MKSNTKTVTQILMVSIFGASLALAQGPGGRPPGGPPPGGGGGAPDGDGPPPAPPLMRALDKDADGTISADELAEAPASLKTLDKNNDGKLTKDEMAPPKPKGDDDEKRSRRKRHVPPVVKVIDADENGEFSAEEIANATKALQALDKNGDGKLSKMETRPGRRMKRD